MTDFELPDPAFKLSWNDGRAAYTVNKPRIGSTDVFTPEQVREIVANDRARRGQPVAWQVRRSDGSPLAVWETCTFELYEATLATGRYAGYENGPPCEVRVLSDNTAPVISVQVKVLPGDPQAEAGEPTMESRVGEFKAWQDDFIQQYGRHPTAYEAWCSGGPDALAETRVALGGCGATDALPTSGWLDAYAAFQAAFDTPVARRKYQDEYADGARKRMRAFNDAMTSAIPDSSQAMGFEEMRQKYLDLLSDVLDAKELMRAKGIENAEFSLMFSAFISLAIAARPPADKWRVVPVQPTDEMMDAWNGAGSFSTWEEAYAKLLDAVPQYQWDMLPGPQALQLDQQALLQPSTPEKKAVTSRRSRPI
ncbi:hypothetical protein [Hydrogenophaga sp. 2FB]|uniref:hypothetical protein n=1 Tax=Hydrogenophaga sp. 2FB TaxID=2502187 RepID=UPI001BB16AB0|nr:hypothetical protein [Hydrogenophaga sp. 2FB]